MRSLLALILFFFSFQLFAANGELRTRFSDTASEFSLKSPTIARLFTLNVGLTNLIVDNPDFLVRNLRQSNVNVGIDINSGSNQIQMTHNQVISDSPFASKSYQLMYAKSFYSQTSAIGVSLSESSRIQPQQTFIDPTTAVTRNRPISLSSKRQEFFYEQVLSENFRGRYSLLFGQRAADRPDHSGVEIRHSYAFSSSLTFRLDLGAIAENKNQTLKDEKGYFSAYWSELTATFQPNLYWMLQAGAGTILEHEYQPSPLILNALTQTGTDTYFLKAIYQDVGWQLSISSKINSNNFGSHSESIIGELSWEI